VVKVGTSEASPPAKTATGLSAVTREPLKSALKPPVSRLITSNAPREKLSVSPGAPRRDARPRDGRRRQPHRHMRLRLHADDGQEGAQVDVAVGGGLVGHRQRLRPAQHVVGAVERARRQEQRGVVGEDVDVLERVELVGDDRRRRADVVGVRRQERPRALVFPRVGEPSTSRGSRLMTCRSPAPTDSRQVDAGDLADLRRLPGGASLTSTVTSAGTSSGLVTTTENCCAAAAPRSDTTALSRSTAQ
jgi:hypothetical protein